MRRRLVTPAAVVLTAFALMASAVGGSLAQDATPEAAMAHPAHIHSGTCDTLGDVVFPLADLTGDDMGMGTPDASMDTMSTPEASTGMEMIRDNVVAQSTSTVEASLDDILAAEHAINVHESAENIGNYIACGDITGEPADGTLQIELSELNGSGTQGMAMLTDNGDGTTEVTVMLMEADMAATPAA